MSTHLLVLTSPCAYTFEHLKTEGIPVILTTPKSQEVRFNTSTATVIGWRDGDVIRATGIPYAMASRFSEPVALEPSEEQFRAINPSPACPQLEVPELDALLGIEPPRLPEAEDCLNLSVTAPDHESAQLRPVMVWIHGGSYVVGAGDSPIFDVRPLCLEQDIIVVSVTYRLGLLGFLGGYLDRPANLGLLDIIEALRWVQMNIQTFGGDPESVTLFGESAGADAIAHLMISEGAEGLFHRAIIQSAPLGIRHDRSAMSEAMGVVAGQVSKDDPVEKLLEVQQEVIQTGNRFGLKGGMPFSPQYGYFPLPAESDAEKEWEKRAKDVDVLIGYNEEETSLFVYTLPTVLKISKIPLIGKIFRKLFVSRTTAKIYGRPADEFVKRHSRGGGNAYSYLLSWGKDRDFLGACHTVDLPLLFGDWQTWNNARLLEDIPEVNLTTDGPRVRELWGQFAKNGRLNGESGQLPGILTWKKG